MKIQNVSPSFKGLAGGWLYRSSEIDGDHTLAGDETLAAGDNVKDYGTLDLAGFTLRPDPTTSNFVIRARRIIGGGGKISVRGCGYTSGAGALRQTNGGSGAYGGAGGDGCSRLRVYAETWEGNVTLEASGGDAEDGANGAGGPGAGSAAGNFPAGNVSVMLGMGLDTGGIGATSNYAGGGPGSGASLAFKLVNISATLKTYFGRLMRDPLRLLMGGFWGTTVDARGADPLGVYSMPGFGGASGTEIPGPAAAGNYSGGSGSGGASPFADPGTPAEGVNGSASVDAGTVSGNGGGGGGGGAGGMLEAYGDRVSGHIILDVSGGDGGNGGNGVVTGFNAADGTRAAGGSGGSGGGGGAVAAVLPRGSYTILRDGGAAGIGGTGASQTGPDPAYAGASGTAGEDGYVIGERR